MWWQTSYRSSLLIYRPLEDERLSWPGWLTYSGRLTRISGHPLATGRAQDGEITLARDWRFTAEPRRPTWKPTYNLTLLIKLYALSQSIITFISCSCIGCHFSIFTIAVCLVLLYFISFSHFNAFVENFTSYVTLYSGLITRTPGLTVFLFPHRFCFSF